MTRPLRFGLLVAALALGGDALAQTLYRCQQADGRTVYQDSKCAEGNRESVVAPPPPRSETPKAAEAADPKALERVIETLANYEACADQVPGFGAKTEPAIKLWKQKNAAAMVQYSQDGAAQRAVRESVGYSRSQNRDTSAEEKKSRAEACDKIADWISKP